MRTFSTANKPPKPAIEFELDGRVMSFTAPSWAPILFGIEAANPVGSIRNMLDWLGAGLPEEDGAYILARLQDLEDPFDIDDAMSIMRGLIEETTSRPTVSPSASSPSPDSESSTDGQPLVESTL